MIIANPIYDVVFKRLMENDKVAKFFIGTLLDQVIESVEVQPQEFTYQKEIGSLAVFRLDFIATIKTETGFKKILIEIQKAKNPIDLMRFRNYLGEQYKKEDKIENDSVVLPITTIYILGFKLPELESSCVKVDRQYMDLITNTIITQKSDFVEKLTHDCYIVQVDRISNRFQTRLDKLLSVFEQRNFVDDKEITKTYGYNLDLEEVKTMTDILHFVGTDPQERKQIENEQEAWRSYYAMYGEKERQFQKELEKQRIELIEKDQVINEKEQALNEKEQALSEKDKIIAELMRKLNENK